MGSIYRRKWKDKAGNVRESDVLWIKYYREGRPMRESTETRKESEARRLLKSREGDVVKGLPITPRTARIRFSELAEDVVNDYKVNGRRSLRDLEMRHRRHVLPFFGQRRAASISTADINRFILKRQGEGASNGEINRELTHVKRAFSLAMKAGKMLHRPHVPMLQENNVRKGFFEREQFDAVRSHLPEHLQRVITVAYVTGWRVPSEVLTLKWSQIDFRAATVTLEPGTTKNQEGRVFPFSDQLRDVFIELRRFTDETQRRLRVVIPWVFHRNDGKRIAGFRKAWARACYNAGLPCHVETKTGEDGKVQIKKIQAVHIPHDLRRTGIRNLVRAGVPERVAMALSGHKTRSVFERYNIVSETDLKDAARRLDTFESNAGTNAGTMTPSAVRVKS